MQRQARKLSALCSHHKQHCLTRLSRPETPQTTTCSKRCRSTDLELVLRGATSHAPDLDLGMAGAMAKGERAA